MRSRWNKQALIALAIVVGILCVLTLSLLDADYGQICREGDDGTPKDCATYGIATYSLVKTLLFFETYDGAITAFSTIFIMFFTWSLKVSTKKMWTATHIAAVAAKASAEHYALVDRAYVFAGPTEIVIEGSCTAFKLTVDNAGRTLSILTRLCVVYSGDPPIGQVPTYDGMQCQPLDLVLNSSSGLNPLDPANKVTLPIDLRWDGVTPFYFWGFLEYKDVFKKPHTTRFCTQIFPEKGKMSPAGGAAWNDWN